MILADTSVWIEYLKGNPLYRVRFAEKLSHGDIFSVSWVFGELFHSANGTRELDLIKAYWDNISKADEENCWIEGGEISCHGGYLNKGVGLIDSAIKIAATKGILRYGRWIKN